MPFLIKLQIIPPPHVPYRHLCRRAILRTGVWRSEAEMGLCASREGKAPQAQRAEANPRGDANLKPA